MDDSNFIDCFVSHSPLTADSSLLLTGQKGLQVIISCLSLTPDTSHTAVVMSGLMRT